EHDLSAGGEARGDQILYDFVLAVNRDRASGQLAEIDAMTSAVEAQLDSAVDQAFAAHPLAESGLIQQIDAALFEHAGANPRLDVFAGVAFEDDRIDPLKT